MYTCALVLCHIRASSLYSRKHVYLTPNFVYNIYHHIIMECGEESRCAGIKMKSERRMILKLRRGTAPVQVEMGRWRGVKREERICKECNSGEVEDVIHWLLRCPTWNSQRQPLMKMIQRSQDDVITTARILTQACHNHQLIAQLSIMWKARFGHV